MCPVTSTKNFNISIDIDEPGDIEIFSHYGSHTRTYRKLLELGLIKKETEKNGAAAG